MWHCHSDIQSALRTICCVCLCLCASVALSQSYEGGRRQSWCECHRDLTLTGFGVGRFKYITMSNTGSGLHSGAFEFNTFVYFVTVPVHAVSIPIYFNGSCLARAYYKSRWKSVCETRSISTFIFIKSTQMYPYDLLLPIGFWWTLSHEATTGGPLSCKV